MIVWWQHETVLPLPILRRLRCRYIVGGKKWWCRTTLGRQKCTPESLIWTASCIMWPNEGTWRTLYVEKRRVSLCWTTLTPRDGSPGSNWGWRDPVSMVNCCTLLIRQLSFLGVPLTGFWSCFPVQSWYNYPTCPYKPTDQPILLSSRWIIWYKLI